MEQDRSDEEIKAWIEETGAVGDPAEDEELPDGSKKNYRSRSFAVSASMTQPMTILTTRHVVGLASTWESL